MLKSAGVDSVQSIQPFEGGNRFSENGDFRTSAEFTEDLEHAPRAGSAGATPRSLQVITTQTNSLFADKNFVMIRKSNHRRADRCDSAHLASGSPYPKELELNQSEQRADDSLSKTRRRPWPLRHDASRTENMDQQPLCRKIPLEDIQVGDSINYQVHLKGMFCFSLGQKVMHVIRADGLMALTEGPNGIATAVDNDGVFRLWWVTTDDGPIAPESILAVYRISPDCRAASCPWCSGRPGQPVFWRPRGCS